MVAKMMTSASFMMLNIGENAERPNARNRTEPFGVPARSVLVELPPIPAAPDRACSFFYFEHCAAAACGATMTFELLH